MPDEQKYTVEIAFDQFHVLGESFPMWVATVKDAQGDVLSIIAKDSKQRAVAAARKAVEEIRNPSTPTTETIEL